MVGGETGALETSVLARSLLVFVHNFRLKIRHSEPKSQSHAVLGRRSVESRTGRHTPQRRHLVSLGTLQSDTFRRHTADSFVTHPSEGPCRAWSDMFQSPLLLSSRVAEVLCPTDC